MNATGAIMTAVNPDNLPYFTEEEKAKERDLVKVADLTLLKGQHNRLKKELEKRQAAFNPIHFEDEYPHASAGYTKDLPSLAPSTEKVFIDDIPEGMYPKKKEEEIF